MEQKKDIGKLFKNKLVDGKKSPTQEVWKKINHTLDQHATRRKRFIYYWLAGGIVLILIGSIVLSNTSKLHKDTQVPIPADTLIGAQPASEVKSDQVENFGEDDTPLPHSNKFQEPPVADTETKNPAPTGSSKSPTKTKKPGKPLETSV